MEHSYGVLFWILYPMRTSRTWSVSSLQVYQDSVLFVYSFTGAFASSPRSQKQYPAIVPCCPWSATAAAILLTSLSDTQTKRDKFPREMQSIWGSDCAQASLVPQMLMEQTECTLCKVSVEHWDIWTVHLNWTRWNLTHCCFPSLEYTIICNMSMIPSLCRKLRYQFNIKVSRNYYRGVHWRLKDFLRCTPLLGDLLCALTSGDTCQPQSICHCWKNGGKDHWLDSRCKFLR